MSYVGIDLGTTNSAICSYDGEHVHLYKSPDQQDVTPSAIFGVIRMETSPCFSPALGCRACGHCRGCN